MYRKNNMLYIEKSDITLMEIIEKNREEKFEANIIGEGQYLRIKWTENRIRESNIANIPIQSLTSSDIQEFLNSTTNYSDSYIKKIYELINSACKKAVKKRLILINPMDDVIKPKSKKLTTGLTEEECIELITKAGGVPILAHPNSLKLSWDNYSEETNTTKGLTLLSHHSSHIYQNILSLQFF